MFKKVAVDWIRTRVLWYWKRRRYQLSHNHCPGELCLLLLKMQKFGKIWSHFSHCRHHQIWSHCFPSSSSSSTSSHISSFAKKAWAKDPKLASLSLFYFPSNLLSDQFLLHSSRLTENWNPISPMAKERIPPIERERDTFLPNFKLNIFGFFFTWSISRLVRLHNIVSPLQLWLFLIKCKSKKQYQETMS